MDFLKSTVEIFKILIEFIKILILLDPLSRLINCVQKFRGNSLDPLPTTPLFGEEVVEDHWSTILEYLADENIGKIGVYGMGGVGKTTIMTYVKNRLNNAKLFDGIIWVTMSKEHNLRMLQSDVAEAINLKLSDEHDEKFRSRKLFEEFSKRKNFVLILDNVWENFPLKDIGIPEPNKENGVKMVLTTRSLDVCDDMETQKNIRVGVLPNVHAWDLFNSKVENVMLSHPEIVNTAKLVAEECKGLPLALITVGRALRNANDVRLWKNALNELRGSTHNIRGMRDDVFTRLKFSYTYLKDKYVQECFLYCSLYPEGCNIDKKELIELWMWEGLIKEDRDTEGMIYKGHDIINELINASMLERVHVKDAEEEVKMHDLIRDMAIGITRESPRFMVKTGVRLKQQPKKDEFVKNIKRISLSRNNIAYLVGQPNCPKLTTLFLNENYQLRYISSSFFLSMRSLIVLDLSWTGVSELPESLSNLVNLRALLLHVCQTLVGLPSLAKLKELRILNLRDTGIRELPPGMEGLVKLKYLNLSNTSCLKTIRVGILMQLFALEELSLRGSKWKFDSTNREAETIANEISGLNELVKLSIDFEGMQSFLIYCKSHPKRSLHKFAFSIYQNGCNARSSSCNLAESVVSMWIDETHIDDTYRCSVLHFDGSHLYIVQCWRTLVIPPDLFDSRAFKRCEIANCYCTEYIFNGGEHSSLSTIETLTLERMDKLKAISKGVMPCGALANLEKLSIIRCAALEHVFTASIPVEVRALHKGEHHGVIQGLRILDISYCDGLKTLFSTDLLQNLQNIEEIKIYHAVGMEQMVEDIAGNIITRNAISLPRLRVLKLNIVPGLQCISKRVLICNSLQEFELCDCSRLSSLPLSIEKPTAKLHGRIVGTRDWWTTLHCEDPNTKRILHPLFDENIRDDSGTSKGRTSRIDLISQV